MSLLRRHFDLGITPEMELQMRLVYEILLDRTGEALTRKEIQDAVRPRLDVPSVSVFWLLEKLIAGGLVVAKRIEDDDYYALGPKSLEEYLDGR